VKRSSLETMHALCGRVLSWPHPMPGPAPVPNGRSRFGNNWSKRLLPRSPRLAP